MDNESLISDTIKLPFSERGNVEKILKQKYGIIVRWAIVTADNDIEVTFTYKKEVL